MIKEFSIDRKTLNKYLELTALPRNKRSSQHSAEPFRKIIIESLQQKTKVAHIFSVLQEQGYSRSFSTLKDYIWKLKKEEDMSRKETMKTKLSRRRLQTYLWSKLHYKSEEEENFQRLFNQYSQLKILKRLLESFQHIMNKKREESALQKWLKEVENSGIKEIQQFAHYLQSDWTAVKHALIYPWSNRLVEGHVNRLKMIKRQMYGRAKFDLLCKKALFKHE